MFKVPDELPDETVAPVNCALSTVTYGMHQIRVPLEGVALIQGAGGLGLSAAAVAREMGAARVIVIDKLPERLKLAQAFGADQTIDASELSYAGSAARAGDAVTGGKGVDVAVEVVGRPEVIAEGLEMLGPSGVYLTMGLVTGGLISHLDMEKVVHKGLTIVGSGNYKPGSCPRCSTCSMRTQGQVPVR